MCCVVIQCNSCVVPVSMASHATPPRRNNDNMYIQCIVCIIVLLVQFCCCVGITIFIGILGMDFVVVVQVLGCVLVRLGVVFWGFQSWFARFTQKITTIYSGLLQHCNTKYMYVNVLTGNIWEGQGRGEWIIYIIVSFYTFDRGWFQKEFSENSDKTPHATYTPIILTNPTHLNPTKILNNSLHINIPHITTTINIQTILTTTTHISPLITTFPHINARKTRKIPNYMGKIANYI